MQRRTRRNFIGTMPAFEVIFEMHAIALIRAPNVEAALALANQYASGSDNEAGKLQLRARSGRVKFGAPCAIPRDIFPMGK